MRITAQSVDRNLLSVPALDVIRRWWYSVGHLDRQIEQIESQVLVAQHTFSTFHYRVHALQWWFHEHLFTYYDDLFEQARRLKVAQDRLEQATDIAATDIARACRLLVKEVHRAFTEHLATLRNHLRSARVLRCLILRFAATIYQFRNKITLQRRYYLVHGSHPIETSFDPEGRLSLGLDGRVPTFLC